MAISTSLRRPALALALALALIFYRTPILPRPFAVTVSASSEYVLRSGCGEVSNGSLSLSLSLSLSRHRQAREPWPWKNLPNARGREVQKRVYAHRTLPLFHTLSETLSYFVGLAQPRRPSTGAAARRVAGRGAGRGQSNWRSGVKPAWLRTASMGLYSISCSLDRRDTRVQPRF